MMHRLILIVALLAGTGAAADTTTTVDGGQLGSVDIVAPAQPTDVVFLFAEKGVAEEAAKEVAGLGAAVAVVDLEKYLATLNASDDTCLYLVSAIEALSHQLQRQFNFANYRGPIVAGIGPGASLAYGALAQAPAATLAGAASVDFMPYLDTKQPLCPEEQSKPAGNGYRFVAAAQLQGWWRVTGTQPIGAAVAEFVGQVHGAELVPNPQGGTPADTLRGLLGPVIGAAAVASTTDDASVADLPVVELPAQSGSDVLAVIFSGDGGWRDLDKQIGEMLSTAGVPVIGVDSLRYFWDEKEPDQVARDLKRIVDHYGTRWGTRHVALIGYSFGADILPFAFNRLDPETRARVVQLSLLGFSRDADFEIHVAGWLGIDTSGDAHPVVPEIERISPSLIQCFYGIEEDDTACVDPGLAKAELFRTAGGHHFDGNYAALAKDILAGLRNRGAAIP